MSGSVRLVLPRNLIGEDFTSLQKVEFGLSENLITQSCFYSNTNNVGSLVNQGKNGIPENPSNFFDGEPQVIEPNTDRVSSVQDWQPAAILILKPERKKIEGKR